jgi:hypothetical protein
VKGASGAGNTLRVTITSSRAGTPRNLGLASTGNLLRLADGANIKVLLEDIALRGLTSATHRGELPDGNPVAQWFSSAQAVDNNTQLLWIGAGNEVTLGNNAQITGNCVGVTGASYGGGVQVIGAGAKLIMSGANSLIAYNSHSNDFSHENDGGGVGVVDGAEFMFSSGKIAYNSARHGGGIMVWGDPAPATLTMSDGAIVEHNASFFAGGNKGGGINVSAYGVFDMNGGIVSNNHAIRGGGIAIMDSTLNMSGGTVRNNRADVAGGGLAIFGGAFNMSGGIVYGKNASVVVDPVYGNEGPGCNSIYYENSSLMPATPRFTVAAYIEGVGAYAAGTAIPQLVCTFYAPYVAP